MRDKIGEFRALERRAAKNALEAYAKTEYNIDLNKQRSFDNMVLDFEAELALRDIETDLTLPDEPVVEQEQVEVKPVEIIASISEAVVKVDKPVTRTPEVTGGGNGFINIPYWIYDWVIANKDWKDRIADCKHYNASRFLEPMKAEIKRSGSVVIRESRNSKFVQIK